MHRKIDWLAKRDTLRATAEALLPDFGKVFPDKSPTEILMNESGVQLKHKNLENKTTRSIIWR